MNSKKDKQKDCQHNWTEVNRTYNQDGTISITFGCTKCPAKRYSTVQKRTRK